MQPCELVMSVSAMACAIAKDNTPDELAVLAAIFSQLGDCLATIAAQQALCQPDDPETSQAGGQATNQTAGQMTNQAAGQATNQPTEQTTNQSVKQTAHLTTGQSAIPLDTRSSCQTVSHRFS